MHGRNFASRELEDTSKAGVLVNEALVKTMGWTTESAIEELVFRRVGR